MNRAGNRNRSGQAGDNLRLTNGFNLAANEKSKYIPASCLLDNHVISEQIGLIGGFVDNIAEERDVIDGVD